VRSHSQYNSRVTTLTFSSFSYSFHFPTLHHNRVGFSPEPHLHFAAYRSSDPTAPTVRVYFEQTAVETSHRKDGTASCEKCESQDQPFPNLQAGTPSIPTTCTSYFLPKAGRWYNHTGEVKILKAAHHDGKGTKE
jgi:hypothetical protein